jgi:hypothetical protein
MSHIIFIQFIDLQKFIIYEGFRLAKIENCDYIILKNIMQAYCVKDNKMTVISTPKYAIQDHTNRLIIEGKCEQCGEKVYRLLSPNEVPNNIEEVIVDGFVKN